jgi:hypothetical protein
MYWSKKMTVEDLIKLLESVEDKTLIVSTVVSRVPEVLGVLRDVECITKGYLILGHTLRGF